MKRSLKLIVASLFALVLPALGWGAEIDFSDSWAEWTTFSDNSAPNSSSTKNHISPTPTSGTGWKYCSGGATVSNDNIVTLGAVDTTVAPWVDFNTQLNLGYAYNPCAVLFTFTVPSAQSYDSAKPFVTLGNGASNCINLRIKEITDTSVTFDAVADQAASGATLTTSKLKAGDRATILISYSEDGLILEKVNEDNTLTTFGTWASLKKSTMNCTRITLGGYHAANSKVQLQYSFSKIAVYRLNPTWALWTHFKGITKGTTILPEISSSHFGVSSSIWRLALNDGTLNPDGSISTGTAAAPAISFNLQTDTDVGYEAADADMTILVAVRNVTGNVLEKPLFHVGNGSTGIGCALKTYSAGSGATLTGTWGNEAWQHGTVASRVFPEANSLAKEGVTYIAMTTGETPARIGVFSQDLTEITWDSIIGLQGSAISANQITFGNFVNQTSNGMNFDLCGLAVHAGVATDAELKASAEAIAQNVGKLTAASPINLLNGLQQYYPFEGSNSASAYGASTDALGDNYAESVNPLDKVFGKCLGATGGINGSSTSIAIPEAKGFTTAFWYTLATVPTDNKRLISRGGPSNNQTNAQYKHGWELICTTEGKLCLNIYDDKETSAANTAGTLYSYTTTDAVYTTNALSHHIAWTRDGSTVKLYVDGSSVAVTSGTNGEISADAVIGKTSYCVSGNLGWWCNELRINSFTSSWNTVTTLAEGEAFDELAFWNRALTADEVKALTALPLSKVLDYPVSRELLTDGFWKQDDAWFDGSVTTSNPGDKNNVEIKVDNTPILAMNEDSASLASLTINGSGTLAFNGEGKLTAAKTIVNADADISEIMADLGSVTIANGKTLTVNYNQAELPYSSLSGTGGALRVINDVTISSALSEFALGGATWVIGKGTTTTLPGESKNYTLSGGVKVEGTFDINATWDTVFSKIILTDGSVWTNSSTNSPGSGSIDGKKQYPNIVLESGSATVSGNNFGSIASEYAKQNLYLNGGTLKFNMNSGKTFYLASANITKSATETDAPAGEIQVLGGTLALIGANADSCAPTTDFVLNQGTIIVKDKSYEFGSLAGTSGTLTLNQGLAVGARNTNTVFGGVISGSGSFTKKGFGTLTLSGESTYTGATAVEAGTLKIAGVIASATTVKSGAAIAGNGTLSGALTLEEGATIDATAGGLQVNSVTWPTTVNIKVPKWEATGDAVVVVRGVTNVPDGTTFTLLNSNGEEITGEAASYTACIVDNQLVLTYGTGSELPEVASPSIASDFANAKTTWSSIAGGSGAVTGDTNTETDGVQYPTLTITFTEPGQTFTFDNTFPLNFAEITIAAVAGVDSSSCRIVSAANAGTITADSTAVNTTVDVSGAKVALGAVTIAEGETLTAGANTALTGLADSGNLCFDATAGAITIDSSTRTIIRDLDTVFITFKGTDTSGVTMNYLDGADSVDYEFGPRIKVESGRHNFGYGCERSGRFATGDSIQNPTIEVASGATLNFEIRDLSGWQGESVGDAVLLIREGGALNFKQHSSSTAYFRDRIYIEGSTDAANPTTVTIENNDKNFVPYGGTGESTAQFTVAEGTEDAPTYAKITAVNAIKTDKPSGATGGFAISVGANATLTFDVATTAGNYAIAKYGAGALHLTKNSTAASPWTVYAGTIGGTGTIGGALTLADGATVEVPADGTLTVTDTVTWPTAKVNFNLGAVTTSGAVPLMKLTATEQKAPTQYAVYLGTTDITDYLDDAGGKVYVDANILYARTTNTSGTNGPIWEALKAITNSETITGITLNGDAELDAVALFTDVATATADGVVTVNEYDFGISGISVNAARQIVATVKVTGATEDVKIASGVTLELYNEANVVIFDGTVEEAKGEITITSASTIDDIIKELKLNTTTSATLSFAVRATTSPTEGTTCDEEIQAAAAEETAE